MKHYLLALASLLVLLVGCGGGSPKSQSTTPEQPAASTDQGTATDSTAPATEPGMGDEDRIPAKPKPFISMGSLLGSNQAGTEAPVSSVPAVEAEKTIARLMEIFVALGDGMKNAGDDCDAVAASIRGWTQSYAAELREMIPKMSALESQLSPERQKEIEQKMKPVAENIQASMQKCAQSEAVKAAVGEMMAALEPAPVKEAEPAEGKKQD